MHYGSYVIQHRIELELGLALDGYVELGLWLVGAQWRFGIFAVGLQTAINLNQRLNPYRVIAGAASKDGAGSA